MHYNKLFVILLFTTTSVVAQHESIAPLQFNPAIKTYLRTHQEEINSRSHNSADTLVLPFRDDFSNPGIYPDINNWTDNNVFINADFPRNPPTIGVATFDGTDAFGNAYDPVNSTLHGSSDTLTSKLIDLFNKPGGTYTIADSIYISFFYQKKGWGDAPDNSDSLILEYYNPTTNQWVRQWSVRGGVAAGQDTFFTKVNLPLLDASLLNVGFRFRFRSYGSLSGMIDIWNLDYVLLNAYGSTGFNDNINEIAYTYRNVSIIRPFTSMPWDHFTVNQSAFLVDTISLRFKYLQQIQPSLTTDFRNEIKDENGGNVFSDAPTTNNIQPLTDSTYHFNIASLNLPVLNPEKATFTSLHRLSEEIVNVGIKAPDDIRTNDSVVFKYEFDNYYSFDDGTAEIGYDLVNSPGGKLAMRFDLAQPDTLRAVRMLFVQQNLNVSNKLFTLKIWSSINPETIIFQQQNLKPVYIDSIDGFATYVIPPTPVQGTIYIGFQQSAADGLHLGFDRNTKNNSRMFYNVNNSWTNVSVADGTFMIRAVMGDSNLFLGINNPSDYAEVFVYPNPATDFIYVSNGNDNSLKNISVSDATGRLILKTDFLADLRIDVRDFPNGIYFLQFINYEKRTIAVKKILVNH